MPTHQYLASCRQPITISVESAATTTTSFGAKGLLHLHRTGDVNTKPLRPSLLHALMRQLYVCPATRPSIVASVLVGSTSCFEPNQSKLVAPQSHCVCMPIDIGADYLKPPLLPPETSIPHLPFRVRVRACVRAHLYEIVVLAVHTLTQTYWLSYISYNTFGNAYSTLTIMLVITY